MLSLNVFRSNAGKVAARRVYLRIASTSNSNRTNSSSSQSSGDSGAQRSSNSSEVSCDVKMNKKGICQDFEKCKGKKVPNQKTVCLYKDRINARANCLEPSVKEYKRKFDPNTAWAVEPEYDPTEWKIDINAAECKNVDECCVVERLDDKLYKESDKRRKYQKTWLDCVEVKPLVEQCPKNDFILPEMVKRPRQKRPDTARVFETCQKVTKLEGKCPRVKNENCPEGRRPPKCIKARARANVGAKRCCPFPSFSECCLEEELPPPDYCECGPDQRGCATGKRG